MGGAAQESLVEVLSRVGGKAEGWSRRPGPRARVGVPGKRVDALAGQVRPAGEGRPRKRCGACSGSCAAS